MAQHTGVRPVRSTAWISVDPANRKYELYVLTPRLIGTATFEATRRWVLDDRSVLQSKNEAEARFLERDAASMQELEPGNYVVTAEAVTQTSDRVVIRLRDGRDVVVYTRG